MSMSERVSAVDIDRWTRRLWRVSQHDRMVIDLAGGIQEVVDDMRRKAGLVPFGWNTVVAAGQGGEPGE